MLKKFLRKLIDLNYEKIKDINISLVFSLCFILYSSNILLAIDDPELTEVYNKLKIYRTDSRLPPELFIDASVKVAAYNKDKNKIFVNPTIIDFIESEYKEYEREIYALIIGHELAHFYNGHAWVHEGANQKGIIKENEIIADRHAIYYSYLAGYDIRVIPNDFMDALYERIPSSSSDYPSLQERKTIFKKAAEDVDEAIQQFETANLLLLMEEYELAIYTYENIAKEFPTKEILNNISVACIKLALKNFDPIDELKGMIYPIEFDNRITLKKIKTKRTRSHSRSITAEEKILRSNLLIKAEKFIQQTIVIDESYTIAYLNLATLYSLKAINETTELSYFLAAASSKINDYEYRIRNKYKGIEEKENIHLSKILTAIIAYHSNNEAAAIKYLSEIEELGLAEYNLFYIKNKTVKGYAIKSEDCTGKRLGDYNLYKKDDLLKFEELLVDSDFFIIGKDNNNVFQVSQIVQEKKFVELLIFEIKKEGEVYKIWTLKTLPGFQGKTCHGIGLGEDVEDLIKNAGDVAFNHINVSRGHTYYSYVYQGSFIYRFDQNNKVDEIIYYYSK